MGPEMLFATVAESILLTSSFQQESVYKKAPVLTEA